ncbi:MAG: hypothetical protein ACK4UN_11675 [Limisphaerales bacterium]
MRLLDGTRTIAAEFFRTGFFILLLSKAVTGLRGARPAQDRRRVEGFYDQALKKK